MAHLTPSSTSGILQHVPPVSAFEIRNDPTTTQPENLLLWIGGLTDTYHSVSYPYTLAASLPPSWSLAQANLSSAGSGWGTSSLSQDVSEISALVSHFRPSRGGKIVLMGHSTGCQDCMHYTTSTDTRGDRAPVDAVILQAPVSDREAMIKDMQPDAFASACDVAEQWCGAGKAEHVLPLDVTAPVFGQCPVTARRWVSLACRGGEDDYFSSDLEDQTLRNTFGKVKVPMLVLYGEKDEFVPEGVDKRGLVSRWMRVVEESGGVVDAQSKELLGGASHNLNGDDEEVVQELVKRVKGFLAGLAA